MGFGSTRAIAITASVIAACATTMIVGSTAAHAGQGPKCTFAPTPVDNGYLSDLLCKRSDGSSGYAQYAGSDSTWWLLDSENADTIADIVRSDGYDDTEGVHHDFDVWDFDESLVSATDLIKAMKSDLGYTHVYVDPMTPGGCTLIADFDVPSKKKK